MMHTSHRPRTPDIGHACLRFPLVQLHPIDNLLDRFLQSPRSKADFDALPYLWDAQPAVGDSCCDSKP